MVATLLVASVLVFIGTTPAAAAPPQPNVAIGVPALDPFIGADVPLTLTFSNNAAVEVGYGPYVDLFLPVTGADGTSGGGPNDGLSFTSASYLGSTPTTSTLTLACDGSDIHPLTGDPVTCPAGFAAGDTMTTITLPFGSFAPNQPDARIDVTAHLSNFADLGHTLPIAAVAGFRFGADPMNNPLVDPPVVQSPPSTSQITPTLITIRKDSTAPEDETATGENFERRWNVEVEIAPGQTVTNLRATDKLPDNLFYTATDAISGSGSVTYEPAPGVWSSESVTVTYPTATNTEDFDLVFHVPELDANGDPVLDPSIGAAVPVNNDASALGDWTPLDPRDPAGTDNAVADPPGPLDTITARSVATQKDVVVSTDTGAAGPTPGDTLTWTIAVQVSDYFDFENLTLSDLASDGQSFDTSYAPQVSINTAAYSGSGPLGSFFTHNTNSPGSVGGCTPTDGGAITVGADLSGYLNSVAPATGGVFFGDAAGGTTATVTFRTVIDSAYRCAFGGDAVNSRDDITNYVEVSGDLAGPSGAVVTDGSSDYVTIVAPAISKSVYAVNGDTSDTGPNITSGDLVTYRVRTTAPLTNVMDTTITDYLPLPTFRMPAVPSPFTDMTSGGPVPPGPMSFLAWSVYLGPADSFSGTTGEYPAISTDATNNSVTFTYGDYQTAPGTSATVMDLLITVVANDEPFADGLHLTNQAQLSSANSPAVTATTDTITQVTLTEPELTITKGVVATDDPSGVFTPAQTGPAGVVWSAPGAAGTRFSAATLSSQNLAAGPVDSNLSGADAGDTVTFAVVVENVGSGVRGAFDVTVSDLVPAGFMMPAGGWNLNVSDGNGAPLAFVGTPASVSLIDPAPTVGALSAADPTSATNVAVITFDATLVSTVSMAETLTNVAEVANFSGSEGGPSFVQQPITDNATVTVSAAALSKSVIATAIGGVPTSPTSLELPIGSTVTYQVTIDVPEGSTADVTAVDVLDAGLAFVSFDSISASPALSTSTPGGFPGVLSSVAVTATGGGPAGPGRVATFDFDTLTNSDTDNSTPETITLTYTVVVLNVSANTTGVSRNNAVGLRVANTPIGSQTSAANIRVNEPSLTVSKSASPTTADAGDLITYTITMNASNATRTSNAYEVTLTDVIPAGLNYLPGSFTHVSGLVPATINPSAPTLSATWNVVAPGQTSTFTFTATVDDTAPSLGGTVTNTARVTYSSITGPQGPSLSPYNTLGVERTGNTSDVGGAANAYNRTGSANVTVNSSTIVKSLLSTSATHTTANDVTIGETATFALDVTVPDGNLGDVTVTDLLPAGLTYVSSSIDIGSFTGSWSGFPALPTPSMSGNNVNWTFENMAVVSGPGVSDNTFRINITARVADVGSNTSGTVLNNTGRVTVAGSQFNSAVVPLDVVVPALSVTKTFTPGEAAANDTVTVTLGVTNTGTSNAYDTVVTDVVDGDVFTAVTPTAPPGWTATVVPQSGDFLVTYTANTGVFLAPSGSQSFTFTATLVSGVGAPTTHTNTADASSTSLDGLSVHERTVTASGQDTLDVTGVDIAVTKTAGVAGAAAGEPITYTITVENLGDRDANGVVLTDTLGADVDFVSATGSYTFSDPTVTWAAFDLAAGASTTRTVVVEVDNPLPMDATTTVNGAEAHDNGAHGADTDPSNNSDSATVTLGSVVDLAVSKTGPASAEPGDTITYTVTVDSVGDRDADDATVTDTLGPDLTFVSATGGGTYNPLTRTVTWTGVDLTGAAGATPQVVFTVTATVASPMPANHATVVNDAEVSHPDDVNTSNDTDQATTTINAVVDLVVSKTDNVTEVVPGDAVTFDVSVTNSGSRGASGVTVTDTLDANHMFVTASNSGVYNPVTHTVAWNLGVIEVGAVVNLTVDVTVADPLVPLSTTTLTNTVVVSDDGTNGPEADPSNNTATDTDVTGVDLVVTKDLVSSGLIPGAEATYEITVTNNGPMTVADLSVNDVMPSDLALVSASVDRGSIDTATWLWTAANLAPTETVTLTVVVDVSLDAAGDQTNTVTVTGVGVGERNLADNTASITNPLTPTADLSLTKTLGSPLVRGASVTWTLTVTNEGPSRATDVTVVDTLPTGLTFTGATGSGTDVWTCSTPSAQVVSCVLDRDMDPSDTATLLVTTSVNSDAPAGEIVNNASVQATESETTAANNTAVAAGSLERLPDPPSPVPTPAPSSPSSQDPASLARTGANPTPLVLVGSALLAAGLVLLMWSRRRRS